MRISVLLLLAGALSGLPHRAAYGQDVPTDSVLRSYYDALLALRDTSTALRASVQAFGRDFRSAGDETLALRAEQLHGHCAAVRRFTANIAAVFSRARAPAHLRDAATELRTALATFRRGLAVECVAGLERGGTTMPADSLRAWGRYRASRIGDLITVFQRAGLVFARRAQIRLPPRSPR